jgi:tRNA (guanine-N7-)-methyltransferase
MRQFPYEFEARKPILFYPEAMERLAGDFLEIGPGRGDFIMALAEQYPDRKVVGIELAKKRYFKLIPRIEKRGITNVTLVRAAAQIAIPRHCEPQTFERIYVLFPDPWPKDRHAPHRLLNSDFLRMLAGLLRHYGLFFFATDHRPYAEWVVENIAGVDELENLGDPFTSQADIADYFPSFFEQKWREEGREIFYVRCRRIMPAG